MKSFAYCEYLMIQTHLVFDGACGWFLSQEVVQVLNILHMKENFPILKTQKKITKIEIKYIKKVNYNN